MLRSIERLSGLPALIAIVVLGVLALLVAGFPFVRRLAWLGAAVVAVIATVNEFRR